MTHVVTRFAANAVGWLSALLMIGSPALAQAPPPDGWKFVGELTSVIAAGNADAFTFGLGTGLENRQGKNLLKLEAGGLRTESVIVTRQAVGSATDYEIRREEDRQKTAEMYYARGRYDRELNPHLLAYGGVDWLRNTFAGISSRSLLAAGLGNIWLDEKDVHFKTSYALTYTLQKDVVPNPAVSDHFAGVRAGWDYWHKLTGTTEFQSLLVGDLNLDRTEDVRADFTNSLTVAISSALALKPSLQLLWRNQPSLTRVPLFAGDGTPLGQTVLTPLENTDMLFRLALVVKL